MLKENTTRQSARRPSCSKLRRNFELDRLVRGGRKADRAGQNAEREGEARRGGASHQNVTRRLGKLVSNCDKQAGTAQFSAVLITQSCLYCTTNCTKNMECTTKGIVFLSFLLNVLSADLASFDA